MFNRLQYIIQVKKNMYLMIKDIYKITQKM